MFQWVNTVLLDTTFIQFHQSDVFTTYYLRIHLHITLPSTSSSCKCTFSTGFLNIIVSTCSQTYITEVLPSQQQTILYIHTKQLPILLFCTYLSSATYIITETWYSMNYSLNTAVWILFPITDLMHNILILANIYGSHGC